ncbi:MAG TPA: c-type cytochrome domain-containing protein [Anaerolineales bacterium]|jgi:mono/diheme cytochrome c family protein|nr:c-type cytochrome domain-containing protein [Anaerolineales bacterium]
MKSTYVKIVLFVLMVGLFSACGAPQTEAPAAPATETASPAAEAPTDVPPVTDTSAATELPAATDPVAATQPPVQGAIVSFANDILPIIQSRCIGCHGGDRTEEGLDLKTHASILAGSEDGPVVIPGDAVNSLLVEMVATQKMPKRGPKLTPPQVQLITDWVNQGALDN